MTRFYDWYLSQSPDWLILKSKVWQRSAANNDGKAICELCKLRSGYAVHHLSYARLGNEQLKDVILLCRNCHETLHGRRTADPSVAEIRTFLDFLKAEDFS